MKCLIFSTTPFSVSIYILLILAHLPSLNGETRDLHALCGNAFSCGTTITGIDYPFYGGARPVDCGYPGLELDCDDDVAKIKIMGVEYRVLTINRTTQVLTIARDDLLDDICLEKPVSTTLDPGLFDYASQHITLTIRYGCPSPGGPGYVPFQCEDFGDGYVSKGPDQGPGTCKASVVVPVKNMSFQSITDLQTTVLAAGFEVRSTVDSAPCTKCKNSSGRCGYNRTSRKFSCFCTNVTSGSETCSRLETNPVSRTPGTPGSSQQVPSPDVIATEPGTDPVSEPKPKPKPGPGKKRSDTPLGVGLGIAGAVVAGIGIGGSIFVCRQRRKRVVAQAAPPTEITDFTAAPKKAFNDFHSESFTKSIPSYPTPKSDLGRGSSYFGVQVFSYTDLQEATDNFHPSKELGDGGFGAVYHGTLRDGRVVAVKRLYENNFKRVEQFMNEVQILARLRHKNLVQLYGCTSKRSQELLLVYEFIPNGTVADHLHGKRANSGLLSWPVRMNIAVESAEALAYLHASDIIHRDVKTTNILLDNDFHVKVADFGLSRLFPTDVTHVSTAPQGTPGYVDPEYYQCYQLTEKSDVYSFGVVLIELISSLQAVDTNRHRNDINLANMAINKIQNHTLNQLIDQTLGFEANSSVRRMATLVAELAFRCLQQERDSRPSMDEVLKVLKEIKNGEFNAQKPEELEIAVEEMWRY